MSQTHQSDLIEKVFVVVSGTEDGIKDIHGVCGDKEMAQMVLNNEKPKIKESGEKSWIHITERAVLRGPTVPE